MKGIARTILFVALGCVALAALAMPFVLPALSFMRAVQTHPSDATMIAHWRERRALFEALAAMLKDDPAPFRLAQDFVQQPEPGLPAERIAQYRALMKEAGIVSLSHDGREMRLLHSASGWSVAGSGKSFVFCDPPAYAAQVEGDLEKAAQDARKGNWQRPLDGRWRLELDKS